MKRSIVLAAMFFAGTCLASETTTPTDADKAAPAPQAEVAQTEQPPTEDRMICERKKRIGSNRIERVCMRASQREAARDRARNDLQRLGACSGNDAACGRSL